MNLLEAVVLGVAQGATEFLPVSSTAHLRIVPAFVGWDDPGAAFTAVVQLGTMLAILVYFRADIVRILGAWLGSLRAGRGAPRSRDAQMGWYIFLGTIPVGLFGVVFRGVIESGARNLYVIGVALIVFGLVLGAADRYGRATRTEEDLTLRDAALIGVAQAAALVPGVSRSGATISAGLALDLDRPAAARFSFLLSIPAVVLSGLFELRKVGDGSVGLAPTIVATAIAFVVGYASIAFLLRYLARNSTIVFVVYRIALGVLVLVLVAGGAIS
jgi:undecaprenyl-diphosphatase